MSYYKNCLIFIICSFFITFSAKVKAEYTDLQNVNWKSCKIRRGNGPQTCFTMEAAQISQSPLANLLFVRDLKFKTNSNVENRRFLYANRALIDEKASKWVLLEAGYDDAPRTHEYYFYPNTQRLTKIR